MDFPLPIPACCRASGNRNWEDAGKSFLRDTRIAGYALLIKSVRRRTTVYRRVTLAGTGQFQEPTRTGRSPMTASKYSDPIGDCVHYRALK